MTKPTIVIVPGSFAPYTAYTNLVASLRAKGYPAVTVSLPSSQKRVGLEPATMSEDASQIRGVVEALIERGREVVVMCHSYGGTPTSQALAGVAVKRIAFLAAIVPKVGQSQADAIDSPLVRALIGSAVNGYMHNNPIQLAPAIGNDFESWESAYECALLLPHHSAVSFEEKITQAAYEKIPVSYLFTENDVIVSPDLQEKYIKQIEEVKGGPISVVRKPWGHNPVWNRVEEVAAILIEEAER